MGVRGLGFGHSDGRRPSGLGPPGRLCLEIIALGLQGAGGEGTHFRTGFPEPEEDLGVEGAEGGPEGPFWLPADGTGPFFLGIKILFLLLNTLLGSSLFTKESVSSVSRLVL